jgi:hypothetical protein
MKTRKIAEMQSIIDDIEQLQQKKKLKFRLKEKHFNYKKGPNN